VSHIVFTTKDLEVAEQMRRDGVPVTWIAETFGCSRSAITRNTDENPEETLAWRQEWKRICMNPELYALHREFAPTTI